MNRKGFEIHPIVAFVIVLAILILMYVLAKEEIIRGGIAAIDPAIGLLDNAPT